MFITYETAASKAEDKNWDAEQQQPYVLNLNVEVPQCRPKRCRRRRWCCCYRAGLHARHRPEVWSLVCRREELQDKGSSGGSCGAPRRALLHLLIVSGIVVIITSRQQRHLDVLHAELVLP